MAEPFEAADALGEKSNANRIVPLSGLAAFLILPALLALIRRSASVRSDPPRGAVAGPAAQPRLRGRAGPAG